MTVSYCQGGRELKRKEENKNSEYHDSQESNQGERKMKMPLSNLVEGLSLPVDLHFSESLTFLRI